MGRRVDPEVLEGFFFEVKGYLPRMRRSLESFASQPSRPEELQEAYRLMHSIKGTSSMVDLGELSHIAGSAEEVLEEVLNGTRLYDGETADYLRAAIQNLEAKLPPESTSFVTPNAEAPAPEYPGSVHPVSGDARHHPEAEAIAEASADSELAATVAEEFHGYLETIGTQLRALESMMYHAPSPRV